MGGAPYKSAKEGGEGDAHLSVSAFNHAHLCLQQLIAHNFAEVLEYSTELRALKAHSMQHSKG